MVHGKGSVAPAISIFDIDLPTDKLGVSSEATLHKSPSSDWFLRVTAASGNPLAFLVS